MAMRTAAGVAVAEMAAVAVTERRSWKLELGARSLSP